MKMHISLLLTMVAACGASDKPAAVAVPDIAKDTGTGNPGAALGCDAEILRECGPGTVDGCTLGLTLVHVCVPKDETAGPPCEQELAKVCPEHQMDGCLMSPPTTATHVCVTQ